MRLTYQKEGQKHVATASNEDVAFRFEGRGARRIIVAEAKADIDLILAQDEIGYPVNFHDRYFLNGYQSWTDTAEYDLATQLRDIRKSPHIISHHFAMDRYGDAPFYHYHLWKSHGYDVFYSRGKNECFLYSLNLDVAYLVIELNKLAIGRGRLHLASTVGGIHLAKGEKVALFDFCFFFSYEEGLKSFQEAFPKLNKKKLFGYTSWYNYYQNINEEIILRDLEALDSRFEVFQIDDGYETFVGDWLDVDPSKFPSGLEPIVKKIHEKGFQAGLWLAPFVAEEKSKLFQEHPEYFAKDGKGNPIKSGGNWSGHYALDFDNAEAMAYVKKCLEHYVTMGFDFFKLDFLYGVALKEPKGESRCQLQKRAYSFLRETLGDKLILGCGANIANSYGVFDYLRIGPDVSLSFDDLAYMRLFHRERVSTKVTLKNTIFRSLFDDRFFANDPDVFLLRDDNIQLSKEQRKALTFINALFGSVLFTSDNVATYDEEKSAILAEALELFRHAEGVTFKVEKKLIHIHYSLHGKVHELIYNTSKGVFVHE